MEQWNIIRRVPSVTNFVQLLFTALCVQPPWSGWLGPVLVERRGLTGEQTWCRRKGQGRVVPATLPPGLTGTHLVAGPEWQGVLPSQTLLESGIGSAVCPIFMRRHFKNELPTSFDALCSIKGSSHEGGKFNLPSGMEECLSLGRKFEF